jgi:predicted dienelactone hydrolase/ABC-type amino acid transport substrate-binding protein
MKQLRRILHMGLSAIALLTAGVAIEAIAPRPAHSAEKIRILVDGPLLFDLSVESLETFAETGEITGDLRLYARFLNEGTLQLLRQGLTRKIPLDVTTVDNLAYSPLGRDALLNVGKVFQVYRGVNGQRALRAAVIGAAANADEEGWTFIDVLKEFPTPAIEIELQDLLELRRQLAVYFSYNDAVVRTIRSQALAEAANEPAFNLSELADLSQPGTYRFTKETVTVTNPAFRQTSEGLSVNYDFDVDAYIPSGLTSPAPIVIISHGFGDVKESFAFIAEHLASYGFVVLLPDHVGSDLAYRQEFLQGRLNTLLSPMEFINRPQEISFLIDRLEELVAESPEWAAQLDLERIGVTGDSLGSTNTLALAGAEINYARIVEACDADNVILNFALYLQCRAQFLPPQNFDLQDPRVKAVVTAHPLGGYLYGPEGFSQIDVPLLMVGGSEDIVAPVVVEQFHPFVWLGSENKHLAMLDIGTHFSSKPGRDGAGGIFALLAGANRDVGSAYYKALSVAFYNVYLREQDEFLPYLSASYGNYLSADQPMGLSIITELLPEQIEAVYGRRPPVPIIPPAIAAAPPPRPQSVLSEIAETGVLKVAFRKDAVPFGFITPDNAWDGYCGEMAIALSDYVSAELDSDVEIRLVELTSTLDNRFDLVTSGAVHLECGPNTIRNDVEGITFSNPIFVTSTEFLVPAEQANAIRPTTPLAGVRLGVLANTTTQRFVEENYPNAAITRFSGLEGRQNAIAATANGEIDAFVGDGILTYGELQLQGRDTNDFALIPEIPLTCEYYGLALPNDDPEWRTLINQFLISDSENPISNLWFSSIYPEELNKAEFCLNQ